MNSNKYILFIGVLLLLTQSLAAQQMTIIPDLSKVSDTSIWTLHNREASVNDGVVHINNKLFDGLLWLNKSDFSNGKIEVDIKGKDVNGKSFVGIAFHGINDSTFDAVYFRPFNFRNPNRNSHSVQYISHPTYTWQKLRKEYPGKYENSLSEVPDPSDWFHATIVIEYPVIEVFVNHSKKPSLVVNQISSRKNGWVGFWVGYNSEGYFKNLKINYN